MPMSPGGRFGWEEAAKVKVLVSCAHLATSLLTFLLQLFVCYILLFCCGVKIEREGREGS